MRETLVACLSDFVSIRRTGRLRSRLRRSASEPVHERFLGDGPLGTWLPWARPIRYPPAEVSHILLPAECELRYADYQVRLANQWIAVLTFLIFGFRDGPNIVVGFAVGRGLQTDR